MRRGILDRTARREEAQARDAERAKRSDKEQILRLHEAGYRAEKEIARLTARIAGAKGAA